jgi:hypothetical protein
MKTTGLSFAEAHASGRKYKRGLNPEFSRYIEDARISVYAAAATDWEIEPETKLLTREQVIKALEAGLYAYNKDFFRYPAAIDIQVVLDTLFGPKDTKE